MISASSPLLDRSASRGHPLGNALLGAVAAVAFLFFFNNYGITVFPLEHQVMRPGQIRLLTPGSFAYVYDFDRSEPDIPLNWRDRVELSENGQRFQEHRSSNAEVLLVGGGRWEHEPGHIVFSTSDNSDPRTNGRTYALAWPAFYRQIFGRVSAWALLLSILALYGLNRCWLWPAKTTRPLDPGRSPSPYWRWHLLGATGVFLVGLYFNTGTLAPYAITTFPYMDKATGYLYNPDHVHFRVLFAFVNNAHRSVWNHALLLRRILYPVLGWPLMRLFGFEAGGTLASLALNAIGLVAFICWLRRRVGQRGAIFAGWLLAVSPGAAYWGGLPYPYALIFPGSLLLLAALFELGESASWRTIAMLSLGMGVFYLGYDFAVFFLPASLLLLAAKRHFRALALSFVLQVLPLGTWLLVLKFGLHQGLENSNSGVYHAIFSSYSVAGGWAQWWLALSQAFDAGWNAFFGANFIFLPALFLVLVGLNPVTSRIRLGGAELALLGAGLILFLFNNLAPPYSGWDMHGGWISRIYQPIFPVFILYAARWWQALPEPAGCARRLVGGLVALTIAANALIVFGPIAMNPLRISEFAYYRFYNHTDVHWVYEYMLRQHGRRPLGFPKPQP